MRVVVAHGNGVNPLELRQVLHGAGLECAAEDCNPLGQLESRLAQGGADLVLVALGEDNDAALHAIRQAAEITSAPILAIGPTNDSSLVLRALRCGARQYLDSQDLRDDLDLALDKLATTGNDPRQRGTVISIYAPTAGSGATTVAANLAGVMSRSRPDEVALIELTNDDCDMGLMLDLTPRYSVSELCQRVRSMDTVALRHSLEKHRTGLQVLVQNSDIQRPEPISPDALRRLVVLVRSMFKTTVLELDAKPSTNQTTAMQMSDVIGLVVRPDVPAVRRAQRALQRAVAEGVPRDRFRLIVNRWDQSGQLPLKSIQEILGFEKAELLPDDPDRINRALNRGLLLTESAGRSGTTRKFAKLATSLNGR